MHEIIGSIGTLLILIGFTFDSEKKMRTFNLIGSICFVIYSSLIHAWSNILLNATLIVIHVVKLCKKK